MKNYLIALAFIGGLLAKPALAKFDLVIKNTTVISAINQQQVMIKEKAWVAVQGNRIVEIGTNEAIPQAKNTIDGSGKYLIPGLMDSHTHLKTMPGLLKSDQHSASMQRAFLARQGSNYLYYGVTQVLDPSNTQEGINKFHQSGLSPNAFYCGAMPIFNGYNARGIEHKDLHHQRPYYIAQEGDPETTTAIKEAHQVKTAVSRLAQDGAQCAKVYIEDGFNMANHIPLMHRKTLKELVDYAHQLGLPVMAHANATDMQSIATDVGVNVLAHGLWNWLAEQNTTKNEQLPPGVTSVLDKIITRDIAYQPTLNVMRSLADLMVDGHLDLKDYKNILPQSQIDWYLSEPGQWFADEMYQDWGGATRQYITNSFRAKLRNGQQVLQYLYERGATILLASDTPPSPTYASQPGLSTYMELQGMYSAGMDLAGILAAATLNNAKQYKLEQDYGTVESGKIANLLMLNSNPLKSITAFDDIDTVILQGKARPRTAFHINNVDQSKVN
ncbi:amidohydrolase family protein [Thalassotalea ganghwensis]